MGSDRLRWFGPLLASRISGKIFVNRRGPGAENVEVVTAETITGEQILQLWTEAGATQAARAFGHRVPDAPISMSICEQANGDGYWPGWRNVAAARQLCAAAWNARHGDKP